MDLLPIPGSRAAGQKGSNLPFSIAEITMMPVESALETMRNSTVCPGRTPSPTPTENLHVNLTSGFKKRSKPQRSYEYGCFNHMSS